jgi:hypothetical protein
VVATDAIVRSSRGFITAQPTPDTVWVRSGCGVSTSWIIKFDGCITIRARRKDRLSGANFQQIGDAQMPKRCARQPTWQPIVLLISRNQGESAGGNGIFQRQTESRY